MNSPSHLFIENFLEGNGSEKSIAEASCKTYSNQPEETDGPAQQGTAEVLLG